ncbi:MAG: DUF1801 domain-containing protein [Anaerolineales bacterium]|jgi:hypothetical protein
MPDGKQAALNEVVQLLAGHDPEVRAVVDQLRDLVRQTVPAANETVNFGWHSLSYRHPQQGYFCGIFPQADNACLLFEFGVLLSDPAEILQGSGKQVRYVLLAPGEPLPVEPLQSLLAAALDLPPKHAEKLALVQAGARPARDEA